MSHDASFMQFAAQAREETSQSLALRNAARCHCPSLHHSTPPPPLTIAAASRPSLCLYCQTS